MLVVTQQESPAPAGELDPVGSAQAANTITVGCGGC
jgi:hypothetical protein